MIVHKKTDECTSSDNEWQWVVQRVKTNDNEWYNEWQRMIMSDNEWQRVVQRMTTSDKNDNEWQRVTISTNFSFFQIREEPTTKYPKENSLNIKEDHWKRSIELRAETSS